MCRRHIRRALSSPPPPRKPPDRGFTGGVVVLRRNRFALGPATRARVFQRCLTFSSSDSKKKHQIRQMVLRTLRPDGPTVSTDTRGPNAGDERTLLWAGKFGRSESLLATPGDQSVIAEGGTHEVYVIRSVRFQIIFSSENVPSTNVGRQRNTTPFLCVAYGFVPIVFTPSFRFGRRTTSDRAGRITGNDFNIDLVFM